MTVSSSPKLYSYVQLFCLFTVALPLCAQTDETIFREFQFDFSTPGARANAMGRAFVGLADEATAAYANPAGLSVLEKPQFSFEIRANDSFYPALGSTNTFEIIQGEPQDTSFDLSRLGFASFALSAGGFNLSAFYVNNLDYRRDPLSEQVRFNPVEGVSGWLGSFSNEHHVRRMEVNTTGLSISRNFGRLDLGLAVGMADLDVDYQYNTVLNTLFTFEIIQSTAQHNSRKPAFVFGSLYRLHPKFKLGFSYKRQPRFTFTEQIRNTEFNTGAEVPVTFKVPDSYQVGFAWQPSDLWTVLLDVDFIQYDQLLDHFTQLVAIRTTGLLLDQNDPFFRFKREDYGIGTDPDIRLGGEYLLPYNGNIFALRAGTFLDPDHKIRFVGESPSDNVSEGVLYAMQEFIYNNRDEGKNNVGLTAGIGFVWRNKLQMDVAFVHSDRFNRTVCSFLYRF